MIRHEPGVRFVLWIAVTRHDHADGLAGRRQLAEARYDGRVDASAQAEYEAARAARAQPINFWMSGQPWRIMSSET